MTSLLKVFTTVVLEDTAYREWHNGMMLEIYRQMYDLYDGKLPPDNYPVYKSSTQMNPRYFFFNKDHKVWRPEYNEKDYKSKEN